MATQGVWLRAELRYSWMPWYYLILLVWGSSTAVGIYDLLTSGFDWGVVVGALLTPTLLFALGFYYFLYVPLQCEVSFARGRVFYRGKGFRGSSAYRSTYVKPLRALRDGLVVSVNSRVRGFRIKFKNDQDATLFVDWCRGAGIPISQSSTSTAS